MAASNYTLKEHIAAAGNYGGSRPASQIKYLVIHYTGNDGDTAEGNGRYFAGNVVKASAHYFVDDDSVIRSVPDLRTAWAVGGKKWSDCGRTGGGTMYGVVTNANSISVELCDTTRDGTYRASEATLRNAASLCRELMDRYHIPIENVYRHFDVTGKHCPAYMMDNAAWRAFKARLHESEETEEDEVVYKYLKDVPEKFRPTIEALMDADIIQGDGSDKTGNGDVINLTHEQVRTLVFVYRGGGFDRQLQAKGLKSAVK